MERPDFFELKNGEKVKLPFSSKEYNNRLSKLRNVMSKVGVDMVILTSIHNIAYYTGFIYCSFGRPYGCVVTHNKIVTILCYNVFCGKNPQGQKGEHYALFIFSVSFSNADRCDSVRSRI